MDEDKNIIYNCELCNFSCNKRSGWERHIITNKHINKQLISKKSEEKVIPVNYTNYICKYCNILFNKRHKYYYHIKICDSKDINNYTNHNSIDPKDKKSNDITIYEPSISNNNYTVDTINSEKTEDLSNILTHKIMLEIINQNKYLMEKNQQMSEEHNENMRSIEEIKHLITEQKHNIIVNNTTNNNSLRNNNNNFNLNIFLNEHCKDAMSMNDFIESLEVNTKNVEYTGRYGYVEGITKIFMDGLNQLDIYRRPMHCTDLKRETLYIREQNSWEKDDEDKTMFKKALNEIVRKNILQIKHWQAENPACDIVNSPEYEFHLIIMQQSIGGGSREKTMRGNEKIIKNIAKAVFIDRKSYKH